MRLQSIHHLRLPLEQLLRHIDLVAEGTRPHLVQVRQVRDGLLRVSLASRAHSVDAQMRRGEAAG